MNRRAIFTAFCRRCRAADKWHDSHEMALELAGLAAMCAEDKVLDLTQVSTETMQRYLWQARGLLPANTPGYLASWRRYSEQR